MKIVISLPSWPRLKAWQWVAIGLVAGAFLLVAFGFYTGEPVFFLKWFFGLQADD